ncbi:thiosulfate/3-mercaptopyruvate sulfurtransferase [Nocardioides daedukensis]|uniref:Thiosulfate/3-mercaptopyruvate sulfurtransferase n=1 Tax=Nocardioides daedukensis TaxID=634462 RepID=A0A7Y9S087_9ACTN|nr:sulfurtransferase [Nocardioides daedukensis]NYG57873.1 thiosulfate/3-mercaptopyruvate sulfurtransferase [Nocardioides daedukensis]
MTSPLISAAELRHQRSGATILDVRYRMGGPAGLEEFESGHVPGAAYVDLDHDLAAPPGEGGRHPLPDPQTFVEAMRRCGVSNDRPVVVYDDWLGHAAARCWWLLRHYGHQDVRVLDGAWAAWQAEGGEIETGAGPIEPGDFDGEPGGMPVVEASGVPEVPVLIDARAPERYRGEVEPVDPVAGHIPGAVNVPTSANVDDTGHFRSGHELAQTYAGVGAVPDTEVAVYCGSGVTAAHDVLALELVGVSAALYPGSWSDWITDPDRPVE